MQADPPGSTGTTRPTGTRGRVMLCAMNFAPEPTGAGRYAGELAQGLAARGHEVEVIAAPPHYPGWHVRPPYSAWRYRRERHQGLPVTRCPLLLRNAGAGIGRLLAPLSFALSAAPVMAWRILRFRPRTVICVEPTLLAAPAALLAARLAGARTVLHVQDLEVDAAFAVGHLPAGGRVARLAAWFDRAMLTRFDRVVTISDRMAERLERKGVAAARIAVVRNWVDTTRIHPLPGPSPYRAELGFADGDFVVLYAGQIGPKQALHQILEAAERLAHVPGLHFVIAGEGPAKAALAQRFGHLPQVRFLGLQPEARLNAFLNLADCHVLPQDPSVEDFVLPSKLGGMLASGRPVLAVAQPASELAAFLGGAALLVSPERLADMDAHLVRLAGDPAAPERGAEARDRRLALASRLAIDRNIDAFAALLELPRSPNGSGSRQA
ncbi:WcaI family glycosyltransferase [Azorhizobium doebereinerae]|uniref:WcaI family glycosyltransferase n=1 Tax=Azorhizobium doebereinerae TaxID=281091 RepID=UPI0009FFAD59|nr:WcaI family glycosyltransferase [Azorhizobium doebereinerae]